MPGRRGPAGPRVRGRGSETASRWPEPHSAPRRRVAGHHAPPPLRDTRSPLAGGGVDVALTLRGQRVDPALAGPRGRPSMAWGGRGERGGCGPRVPGGGRGSPRGEAGPGDSTAAGRAGVPKGNEGAAHRRSRPRSAGPRLGLPAAPASRSPSLPAAPAQAAPQRPLAPRRGDTGGPSARLRRSSRASDVMDISSAAKSCVTLGEALPCSGLRGQREAARWQCAGAQEGTHRSEVRRRHSVRHSMGHLMDLRQK